MKPERQNLIHDLMDGAQSLRREATLNAGARILHRRRLKRRTLRGLAALIMLVFGGLCFDRMNPLKLSQQHLTAASALPNQAQELSDDDLLKLFPGTPVGLATLPDGHKRLIFPRPGDEKQFIKQL